MSIEVPRQPDNIPVAEAWRRLADEPTAILIDVRTRAEWSFVGVPDLSAIKRPLILVEWQSFPDNRPNPAFVEELSRELAAIGASASSELFFICRSGARSLRAAEAMMRAGFERCSNVAEGFEGPLDEERHRGTRSGWKAQGLPWVQG